MLTVITGPMFSGKSSKLITMLMSYAIAGKNALAFKPNIDNRFEIEKAIVSHTNNQFPAIVLPCDSPGDSINSLPLVLTPHVVGFDEAQFFHKEELLETVDYLMEKKLCVICAGLSQDYSGKPFGAMPHLLSIADEIISLKAVCSNCKSIGIATRTYRKSNDGDQVVVGGVDKYEARCYTCWTVGNEV